MRGVFLSYRRSDSYPAARSLFDCLARQYGAGNVFIRPLQPGETILVKPTALLYKDSSVAMQLHIEHPGNSWRSWRSWGERPDNGTGAQQVSNSAVGTALSYARFIRRVQAFKFRRAI